MEMGKGKTENEFEKTMRGFLKQGRDKLEKDLAGTREAIRLIAVEKTRDFIRTMDKGLDKGEREFLSALIVSGMVQSFCYGYGIGKIEGKTDKRVYI